MNNDIYRTLCAHAFYSFSEIEWDFESLTTREKCIIKNQKNLDMIRQEVMIKSESENLGLVADELPEKAGGPPRA